MSNNLFNKKIDESKVPKENPYLNHGFNSRQSEIIDNDNIFNFCLYSRLNVNTFLDNNNNIQTNLNNGLNKKSNNEINQDMVMDIEMSDKIEENSISL